MVKLILTINEMTSLNLKDITAIGTDISIEEVGKNATKAEIKVGNMLKERLKLNENYNLKVILKSQKKI